MAQIILSTLNARYFHAALGLRYLKANMGALGADTAIREFIIDTPPQQIAEQLLAERPEIIGFGVYIWNVEQTTRTIALLKQIAPEITIVIGGPEVSYEWHEQAITGYADYLIAGQADLAFAELCGQLLAGRRPLVKWLQPPVPAPDDLTLPYEFYSDEDVANRFLYVEASRGCPFKCEFCLSALDKTATPFDQARFLAAMERLYQRGARHFKFVDRTFNLKIENSVRILEFFLDRLDERLFLHFEAIPDHLPERLREIIVKFPPGQLQFEVGIQSFNPEVQALISRRQNNEKSCDNLRWLREHSPVHIHSDLIAGLPGEDLASFARGFNTLVALNPHEIQVGILKRLRGAPIIRHTEAYGLRFNPYPPYNVLATHHIGFADMQRLNRFARYWDLIGNSGRFQHTRPLLLGADPFGRFMALGDWLYQHAGQTHQIALARLFRLLHQAMGELFADIDADTLFATLYRDYEASGMRGEQNFEQLVGTMPARAPATGVTPSRQARHRQSL